MTINKLDAIEFRLKELHDLSFLKKYGTAFWGLDETGSGCICVGMEDAKRKNFCKIAGVDTMEAEVSPKESVEILKKAKSNRGFVFFFAECKSKGICCRRFYDGSIMYDFSTDVTTICEQAGLLKTEIH